MKNELKTEFIEGIKIFNNVSFPFSEVEKSLIQQEKKLDRLFYLFKEEMEYNINVTNNFPLAYKYVREVQHEFFCLLKYSLKKNSTGILLKRKLMIGINHMSFHKKYYPVEYENIKLRFSVCKQAIDYIVFKSCVLKELRDDYFKHHIITRNKLIWNGTQTDLIEMCRFFYDTKLITRTDGNLALKEIIYTFSNVLNLKISSIYSKLGKQRQRRQGKSTKIYRIWETYQQKRL